VKVGKPTATRAQRRRSEPVQQVLWKPRGGKRRGAGRTIDWFSSAVMFPDWAEYGEEAFLWRGPATYDPLVVYQPKTWLLRAGWKKAGSISYRDVPSAKR